MDRKALHDQVHLVLMQALVCSMPFPMLISNVLIIMALINWLASGDIANKARIAFSRPLTLLMLAFFLLHLVSILFSTNTTEAWNIAERRLPLLIFPLLIFQGNPGLDDLKKILRAFCAGLAGAGIICLANAMYQYLHQGSPEHFLYHTLSSVIGINAVYLSAYCVLGIIILTNIRLMNHYATLLLTGFLLLFCVLLSSKMMLLFLIAYLFIHLVKKVKNKSYQRLGALGLVLICVGIAFIPGIRQRFVNEYSSGFDVIKQDRYRYDTPFSGASLRVVLWKQSMIILNAEQAWLMGVGSGDFQDKLNEQYQRAGLYTGNPENNDTGYIGYGPHNQYVETLLYSGGIGLLVFLTLIFIQFRSAVQFKDWMGGAFTVLCICFFLSESVLSTNKGVVFYALFSVLFYANNYFNKSH